MCERLKYLRTCKRLTIEQQNIDDSEDNLEVLLDMEVHSLLKT